MKRLTDIAHELGIKPFGTVGYRTPELEAYFRMNEDELKSGAVSEQQIYTVYLLDKVGNYLREKNGQSVSKINQYPVNVDCLPYTICYDAQKKLEEYYYRYLRIHQFRRKPSEKEGDAFVQKMQTPANGVFTYTNVNNWLWRSAFPYSREEREKYPHIKPQTPHASFRFTANIGYDKAWIEKMDAFIKKYGGKYKTPVNPSDSNRLDSLNVYIYTLSKEPTEAMKQEFLEIVKPYLRAENSEWMLGHEIASGVTWAVEPKSGDQQELARLKREQSYIRGLAAQNMAIARGYGLSEPSVGMRMANREVNDLLSRMVISPDTRKRSQKIIDMLMMPILAPHVNEQIRLLGADITAVNMRGFKSRSAYPTDAVGLTPLMYAAKCARPDIVQTLLEKGADAVGDGGSNLFHALAEYVYGDEREKIEQITKIVMDSLQKQSPNEANKLKQIMFSALDEHGYNPMTLAMLNGNKAVAQIYKKMGVVPQKLEDLDKTACSETGKKHYAEMYRALYPPVDTGKSY